MDLRQFYQKIMTFEESIKSDEVVVVSNETPDGGKAGVKSEVKRSHAARMLAEGRVRLATEEESQLFHQEKAEAYKRGQEILSSGKVQLALLTESEMKVIKSAFKNK